MGCSLSTQRVQSNIVEPAKLTHSRSEPVLFKENKLTNAVSLTNSSPVAEEAIQKLRLSSLPRPIINILPSVQQSSRNLNSQQGVPLGRAADDRKALAPPCDNQIFPMIKDRRGSINLASQDKALISSFANGHRTRPSLDKPIDTVEVFSKRSVRNILSEVDHKSELLSLKDSILPSNRGSLERESRVEINHLNVPATTLETPNLESARSTAIKIDPSKVRSFTPKYSKTLTSIQSNLVNKHKVILPSPKSLKPSTNANLVISDKVSSPFKKTDALENSSRVLFDQKLNKIERLASNQSNDNQNAEFSAKICEANTLEHRNATEASPDANSPSHSRGNLRSALEQSKYLSSMKRALEDSVERKQNRVSKRPTANSRVILASKPNNQLSSLVSPKVGPLFVRTQKIQIIRKYNCSKEAITQNNYSRHSAKDSKMDQSLSANKILSKDDEASFCSSNSKLLDELMKIDDDFEHKVNRNIKADQTLELQSSHSDTMTISRKGSQILLNESANKQSEESCITFKNVSSQVESMPRVLSKELIESICHNNYPNAEIA